MATDVVSGALKVVAAIVLAFVGLILLGQIPFFFREQAFDRAVAEIKPDMTIRQVLEAAPEGSSVWMTIVPEASEAEATRCRQALASVANTGAPQSAAWHPKPHTVDAKAQAEFVAAIEQLKQAQARIDKEKSTLSSMQETYRKMGYGSSVYDSN